MDKQYEIFWNYLYQRDITGSEQIAKEALRIVQTKKYIQHDKMHLEKILEDPEKLFQVMKENTKSDVLGYFPGDRDLFFELFEMGKDFNILDFTHETLKNDKYGRLFTPKYLTDFIFQMINENKNQKILIPEAEKFLPFLEVILEKYKDNEFTLTSEDFLINEILKTAFEDHKNIKTKFVSLYKKLSLDSKFDYIISIPAFGYRKNITESLEDTPEDFISSDMEGRAIENLVKHIKNNGILYTVVPSRFTFSTGSSRKLRKWLNKNYQLNFIYSLPEGTFRPYSGIKTYLISLFDEKVKNVKIAKLELDKNQLTVKNEKEISSDEFKKQNDWQIDLFLNKDNEMIHSFNDSKVKKIKIKDIAEIFRGKSILKKDVQPGDYKVLNISDIHEGEINFKNMRTINEDPRKVLRYEIKYDDLLLSCRGTIDKVAVFKSRNHKVIASANILIIRLKNKEVLSDYLKIFLESPLGSALIKSFQRGSSIMNINQEDVKELRIPMISLKKQKDIISKYNDEKRIFKEVTEKANKRWNENKTEIYSQLWKQEG
jgi:type I restriction enzyme M protein